MQLRNLGGCLALMVGLLVANPTRVLAEDLLGIGGTEPALEVAGTGAGASGSAPVSAEEAEMRSAAAGLLAGLGCNEDMAARQIKAEVVFEIFGIRPPIQGPIPREQVEQYRPRLVAVLAGMKAQNPDSLACLATWNREVLASMPTDPPSPEAKAVLESVRYLFDTVGVEVAKASGEPVP